MKQSSPPSWEAGGEGRGCGSCWCWTRLLNPEGFPFLTAWSSPQPSWVRNTWYPGPGRTSISGGLDIPVHSFIERGNSGRGEQDGRDSWWVLGKFWCFPAVKGHRTTHCLESMTVSVCVCHQSIRIYVSLCNVISSCILGFSVAMQLPSL